MSSVSPNVIHPGKIENIPDHVADTQTIFIGGPCTGKTAICRSLDETVYVNTGEDLKSLDTDLPIIIDNAYQILTDPQIDASERMRSLEDHQSGVCYVFRPYEFDWIVGNSSNVTFDFDSVQVLSLVYNDSETISELYSIDNNLSENKISSFVDHLEYRFSYSNAPIEDYQSYLPYCSIKASNNAVERIITGDSVMDKITKFAKNSDLSAYTRHATTQIPNSIVATLSGLVGGGAFASGVGAVALFAAAPILINQTLEDEFEFEQNLGEVLGHELLPHHQEKLERETDLPPRTFETLGKFADPVTAQRFNKVVEEQETFRNVIQETTFEVGHDTNSFSELVDLLANETVPITELVSSEFNDAILSPNSLIKRQKKRVIDEIQAAASIPETKAKERVNKLFDQPLREKKLKTDFETKAPDKGTLLAYGEIGGGVTTFAKGMLEKYAVDGYNVGVINSTTPEILRPKLRSMNTESERLALVYSVGHRGSFSPHDFQSLFGEEVFDLYDVLIIECSQEKIDSIRSAWEQTRDISYTSASSRLQPKAEIQLSGIDQQSLKRIPQTLSTLESEAADVIADTADGNPTIAVEATLETIENGLGSLRGVQGRELIRDRLKGALQELEDNHGKTSLDILVMLAGTRGVDTERSLAELLDIGERKIKMVLNNNLSSYVQKDADGKLVISPHIYAVTIFELTWFTKAGEEWLLSDRGEKFTEKIHNSNQWNLVGLITNLSEFQSIELKTTSAPSEKTVISLIEDLLDQAELVTLPTILAVVGIYQVPIQLETLTKEDRLHKCFDLILEVSDNESTEMFNQYCPLIVTAMAGVTIAAFEDDNRTAERFLMFGTNLFRKIIHRNHGYPELANLMIINYYSGVLSPLVHGSDLRSVKPFVKEVTQRAASIQNGSDVDDVFLVEFYSHILAPHFQMDDSPDNFDEWLNFIINEILEANERSGGLTGLEVPSNNIISSESRQFQTSPDRVVIQVFARALVINSSRDPADRIEWIKNTKTRLNHCKNQLNKHSDSHTDTVGDDVMLMSVPLWSTILGHLADLHPPSWADKWINSAEEQILEEFDTATNHDKKEATTANLTDKQIHRVWGWFVGNVVFEKRDLGVPEEWAERLVDLLQKQSEKAPVPAVVELEGYSWMLCRAVQSHIATDDEDLVEPWVQWYFDHATEPAEAEKIKLEPGVALAEPFAVAPKCFEVDLTDNFIYYVIKKLEKESDFPQQAVVGSCANILMIEEVPDSELFEWVYEIVCSFSVRQNKDNLDLSIRILCAEILLFILDYQQEDVTQRIAEFFIPKLFQREGSEAIFDLISLTMWELSQVPFDEFNSYSRIVISEAANYLSEADRLELREDLAKKLRSGSESDYTEVWIEEFMKWTKD